MNKYEKIPKNMRKYEKIPKNMRKQWAVKVWVVHGGVDLAVNLFLPGGNILVGTFWRERDILFGGVFFLAGTWTVPSRLGF